MKLRKIPIYDQTGKVIDTVSQYVTSIGASKVAKVAACEWTLRFGEPGWVIKLKEAK